MPTTTKSKSKPASKPAAAKSGASKATKSTKPAAKPAKPAAPAKPPKVGGAGPLQKRLGLIPNQVVVLIDAPSSIPDKLGELPEGVELRHSAMRGAGFDLAILFVPNQNTLQRRFSQLAKLMRPNGALWVAWPCKSSGFHCDVTYDLAKAVALKDGLVDSGTTDVDEIWTGMRFIAKPGLAVITEIK
ncbi:MAG: hypothetical protein K2W85_06800 [Phycisphaerales bacterium]|nr:hypothetical protein [Phycisphaerales bacterium]